MLDLVVVQVEHGQARALHVMQQPTDVFFSVICIIDLIFFISGIKKMVVVLFILDFDGVMTDGGLWFKSNGDIL